MKKFLLALIALITSLLSFGIVSEASTLDSIDIYLKYSSLNTAAKAEQIAPTSITDAGEERIDTYTGGVSYYSEDLKLPGINGFDLVVGRKFNPAKDMDILGNSQYVSVTGYNYPGDEGLDDAVGYKYVFPYHLTENCSDAPIFVAYDSICDMLNAESNLARIGITGNYTDYKYNLGDSESRYSWIINSPSETGITGQSDFYIYDDIVGNSITLYRDTSKGYSVLDSRIEDSFYYETIETITPKMFIGGGWEYAIPTINEWNPGRDNLAETDCMYGLFYDPDTRLNVNFRIRYNDSYILDGCCNCEFTFEEIPSHDTDLYRIEIDSVDPDFEYQIIRYDGVKFSFFNDELSYMEDRFGNRITFTYPNSDTVSIVDTMGRNVVLTNDGISVDGEDIVNYTFAVTNNTTEDPNNLFTDDDTCSLTVAYKVGTNKYKTIIYNMSQREKVYELFSSNNTISQTLSLSKIMIDSITISTGATRHYSYSEAERRTYSVDDRIEGSEVNHWHPIMEHRCDERYDVQSGSETLENRQVFEYPTALSTVITFPGRDGYSITETFDKKFNMIKRVTECTDLDYTITEEYEYSLNRGVYLVNEKEYTKENGAGSTVSYTDEYSYHSNNNLLMKIRRDGVDIYIATYSNYGLLETEYQLCEDDEYKGINNVITNGTITEKTYVTKAEDSSTPVEEESVSYTYDTYGNLASVDGDGVYVEYSYTYGDYSAETEPAYSVIITETYPDVDNITTSQGAFFSGDVTKTSYYDKWGNLVKTVDGEGNITTYTYDYLGRVLKVTNPDNTTQVYSYNDTTNRIYITDENGKRIMYRFDGIGRELGLYHINEAGTTWAITYYQSYDSYGNMMGHSPYRDGIADSTTKYTYYSDNSTKTERLRNRLSGSIISENVYTYTIPENNVNAVAVTRTKTDTEDVVITNYTNQYGFKIKDTVEHDSTVYEQSYTTDNAGNILTVKDFKGVTAHTYTYDYRGRVLKDTFPIGSTTNVYDGAFLSQTKDSYNRVVKTYAYNTQGKLISEITPIDNDTDNIVDYYYDRNGNLTKTVTTTGDGTTTRTVSNVYDNRNRLIAANDGSGFYTRYEYDNMANVTRMATGVSTLTEALDRDVHSVTDYEYSYRDFLTTVTDPMGYTESYTYNSRGTKLTYTDKNGTLFEYTYNGAPWLLSETATGTDNTTQTISYTYDYLGNIAQMVDESGTVVYTYDGLGNVLTETKGTLVKEYSYDLNGNRTSADITQGTFSHLVEYTYDNNNRLSRVTDDNGYTQYVYDKNNRLTSEKSYNGSTLSKLITQSEYTYYPGGLLKSKENAVGTGLSQSATENDSYTLTYYADGNIATVNNNNSVTTYVYDSANRLLSESINGTLKASYTYDARGNRATMTESDRVTTYTYNKNNYITSAITEGDGIYIYHYYDLNKNGNMVEDYWGPGNDEHIGNSYDLFGRLQRSYNTNDNLVASYTYDGNGIRISKTTPEGTINYINDGGYVVGEVSGDSVIKYTYGNSLVNINNNGTLGYYQTDEHGNVSAIVNTSRSIVADYDFDAFGNETISTENYYNPMRYCGEYYDGETGLIYLRARYYDPSIGRFISEDTHWNLENMIYGDKEYEDEEIKTPDAQAISQASNLYVYCMNNPVMFVDFDGKLVYLIGVSASVSIGVNLQPEAYIAFDEYGNVGFVWSEGIGGAPIGASFTGTTGCVDVATIYDLENAMVSTTTLVGEALVGGATAIIDGTGQVGTLLSLGVGVGLPISQSANTSDTSVFGFNIPKAWNSIVDWFE